jgi:hypothetical protein
MNMSFYTGNSIYDDDVLNIFTRQLCMKQLRKKILIIDVCTPITSCMYDIEFISIFYLL